MLAVITEVTVKLLPRPQRAQVVLAAFDDVAKAGAAVGNIIAAGVIPAGLEMMDRLAIQAAEAFVHAGYPLDCEALLLCEVDGVNEEVSDDIFTVREVLTASGATEIRTAESEEQRLKFWAGRKAAFPAVGRLAPDYYCMDGTIPRGATAARAETHQRDERGIWPGGRQRVPCRRRQPASADPVRRQPARASCTRPKTSAARFWSCASKSAAPSPASTASGWRRSTRCARSSPRPELAALPRGEGRVRPRHIAQPRQGRARTASLRRVGRDAHPRRPVAASRAAEVLMLDSLDRAHPRRRMNTTRRSSSRAAAARRSMAIPMKARCSACARVIRRGRLPAEGTGADRARRHPAHRNRGAARRTESDAGIRAAALCRQRHARRLHRRRPVRPAPSLRRRRARLRARRAASSTAPASRCASAAR